MKQQAVVLKTNNDNTAVIAVTRQTACGGDCGSCGGCSLPMQMIKVTVRNDIGARAGDQVSVETQTKKVFLSAAVTYILPVILMIAFYFLPLAKEGLKIMMSFLGLFAGGLICRAYSRFLAAHPSFTAEIREILS